MFSFHSPTVETRPTIAITTHRVTLSLSKGRGVRKRAFENITDLPATDESTFVRSSAVLSSEICCQFLPPRGRAAAWRIPPRNAYGRSLVFTARTALIGKTSKRVETSLADWVLTLKGVMPRITVRR
jgi:hypothetical protein